MEKKKLIDARVFYFLETMIICLVLSGKYSEPLLEQDYSLRFHKCFPQSHRYQTQVGHVSFWLRVFRTQFAKSTIEENILYIKF